MIKIYLTLVIISAVCFIMVKWGSDIYMQKHYIRVKKTPLNEKMYSWAMCIILILLLVSPICAFLQMAFNKDTFYSMLIDTLEKDENWERKE